MVANLWTKINQVSTTAVSGDTVIYETVQLRKKYNVSDFFSVHFKEISLPYKCCQPVIF